MAQQENNIFNLIRALDFDNIKNMVLRDPTILNPQQMENTTDIVTPLYFSIGQQETAAYAEHDLLTQISVFLAQQSNKEQIDFVNDENGVKTSTLVFALEMGVLPIVHAILDKGPTVTLENIDYAKKISYGHEIEILEKMKNLYIRNNRMQLVLKRKGDRSVHPIYSQFNRTTGGTKKLKKLKKRKERKTKYARNQNNNGITKKNRVNKSSKHIKVNKSKSKKSKHHNSKLRKTRTLRNRKTK